MAKIKRCECCTEKCPQAERAHQASLGRMYATNEFVSILKKIESGELVEVAHGRWQATDEAGIYTCSNCGFPDTRPEFRKRCSNCGAYMTKEEQQ